MAVYVHRGLLVWPSPKIQSLSFHVSFLFSPAEKPKMFNYCALKNFGARCCMLYGYITLKETEHKNLFGKLTDVDDFNYLNGQNDARSLSISKMVLI